MHQNKSIKDIAQELFSADAKVLEDDILFVKDYLVNDVETRENIKQKFINELNDLTELVPLIMDTPQLGVTLSRIEECQAIISDPNRLTDEVLKEIKRDVFTNTFDFPTASLIAKSRNIKVINFNDNVHNPIQDDLVQSIDDLKPNNNKPIILLKNNHYVTVIIHKDNSNNLHLVLHDSDAQVFNVAILGRFRNEMFARDLVFESNVDLSHKYQTTNKCFDCSVNFVAKLEEDGFNAAVADSKQYSSKIKDSFADPNSDKIFRMGLIQDYFTNIIPQIDPGDFEAIYKPEVAQLIYNIDMADVNLYKSNVDSKDDSLVESDAKFILSDKLRNLEKDLNSYSKILLNVYHMNQEVKPQDENYYINLFNKEIKAWGLDKLFDSNDQYQYVVDANLQQILNSMAKANKVNELKNETDQAYGDCINALKLYKEDTADKGIKCVLEQHLQSAILLNEVFLNELDHDYVHIKEYQGRASQLRDIEGMIKGQDSKDLPNMSP